MIGKTEREEVKENEKEKEKEREIHNSTGDMEHETNIKMTAGKEISKNRKREFTTKANVGRMSKQNVWEETDKKSTSDELQEVKETTENNEAIDENAKKTFFEHLNKKKKLDNYNEEEYKESKFVIHYYDWEQIPDVCNLPYALIHEQNNELFKYYKKNYDLFMRGKNNHLQEIEQTHTRNMERHKKKEEKEEKEKVEVKQEKEDKQERQREIKETQTEMHTMAEGNQGETEDSIEKCSTDDSEETCPHKKFMCSIIYEDIKMHFTKNNKQKITDVNTMEKTIAPVGGDRPEKEKKESFSEQHEDINNKEKKTEIEKEKEKEREKEKEKEKEPVLEASKKEETDWTKDFIALTNIQILEKHSNYFNDWKTIEILLPQIIDCCCSPRSSVCKISFLAIKHLCMSWKNKMTNLHNLFMHIFPFVIKKLDVKNNFLKNCVITTVEEFMLYGNTVNNFQMLRVISQESNNKNTIIAKYMAYYVYSFLKNLSKEKLEQIPLTELATPFLNFLNAKLEITRKYIKQVFPLLLKVKTEEEIIECFKNGISKKENFKLIEIKIRNLLDDSLNNRPPLKKSYSSFQEFRTMQRMGSFQQVSSISSNTFFEK